MEKLDSFNYFLPTKIIAGNGCSKQVAAEIKALGATRVLLVTDEGVRLAGATLIAEESLNVGGTMYEVFDQVEIDPTIATVNMGYTLAKEIGCDAVVVVGGGSPICVGKAIGLLLANGGSIRDYEGMNRPVQTPAPVVVCPTTAGSGSEVSPYFLINDEDNHYKMSFYSPTYHPRVAILDPQLLKTLPYWQAVCSSMDALAHAVEAYSTVKASPVSDALALQAVRLLYSNLLQAAATPCLEARLNMLIGSSLANMACANAGLALAHAASFGLYELPHGYACGLMLPFVMKYNLPVMVDRTANLAVAMGGDVYSKNRRELAESALDLIKRLYTDAGFPTHLKETDSPRDKIEEMVERTIAAPQTSLNIRSSRKEDIKKLFEWAYKGY